MYTPQVSLTDDSRDCYHSKLGHPWTARVRRRPSQSAMAIQLAPTAPLVGGLTLHQSYSSILYV